MDKIVECVPNISDGVHPEVYNTIAKSCEKIPGVKLLDVDPGVATNRTVITFAGPPEAVVDAAFEIIKLSKELIDMRSHKGEHPRMGATDVCPFVPISGVTLEECADLARRLGRRVGEELGIWVYLYEAAATKTEWKSLSNIRKGEYESLAAREGDPAWRPDFGPEKFDPKFGGVVIGARKFLVAYNININSNNVKIAKDIAMNIRETGRSKRAWYPDGEILKNPDGTPINEPGIFNHCKSTAWIIPEYNCAQITMNLTDIDVTPVHKVFEEVDRQARERGMRVTGSEIVGLVPLQTLQEAGAFYLQKQGLSAAVPEEELILSAVRSLGLNDVAKFNPSEKIVEYKFKKNGPLVAMDLRKFANTLASNEPAPGGGSVAALCGTLAASLATMVANLTHGKYDYKESWEKMEKLGIDGQKQKDWFLDAIDRDTASFNVVMDAMKLPKKTKEQQAERTRAIEVANQGCTLVPLQVLENCLKVLPLLDSAVELGNRNCISDVGVGLHCVRTCAEGAALNVRINLSSVTDAVFIKNSSEKMNFALNKVREQTAHSLQKVEAIFASLKK